VGMRIFGYAVICFFISLNGYGAELKCWDYPDIYHPKVDISKNERGYEFELVSLPKVQELINQLFPQNDNSFAERVTINFKNCHVSASRKNIITCSEPIDASYYDWTGKLMNQFVFDDMSKLSFVSTSYNTEESTSGLVDWISLRIQLVHKAESANEEIKFYSKPLCGGA